MGISKRLRFELFKRDNFTCQYCGRQTPLVVLQIDHIIPRAEGGSDDADNLIASCVDCNLGKGAVPLGTQKVKNSRSEKMRLEGEKQAQITEYEKFLRAQKKQVEEQIDALNSVWLNLAEGKFNLSEQGKISLRNFVTKLTFHEIEEAMTIAAGRIPFERIEGRFKYFCGICHNKIAEKAGDPHRAIFKEIQSYFTNQLKGSGWHDERKLKELSRLYPKDDLIQSIDAAFSEYRQNYWTAFCEALTELTGESKG